MIEHIGKLITSYYAWYADIMHSPVTFKQLVIACLIWMISSFIICVSILKFPKSKFEDWSIYKIVCFVIAAVWPIVLHVLLMFGPALIPITLVALILVFIWFKIFPSSKTEKPVKTELIEKDTNRSFCPTCESKSAYRS